MKRFLKSFAPNNPFKKVSWGVGVVIISLIAALNVEHAIVGNGGYAYGYTFNLQGASQDQIKTYALQYANSRLSPVDSSTQVVLEKSVTSEELVSLGLDAVNPGLIDQPPYALVVLKGNFDVASNNVQYKYAPAELKKPWKYASIVFDLSSRKELTCCKIGRTSLRSAVHKPQINSLQALRSSEPASQIISPDGAIFHKVLNDPSLPELKTLPSVDPNASAVQMADGSKITPAPEPKPYHYGDVLPTLLPDTKNP